MVQQHLPAPREQHPQGMGEPGLQQPPCAPGACSRNGSVASQESVVVWGCFWGT